MTHFWHFLVSLCQDFEQFGEILRLKFFIKLKNRLGYGNEFKPILRIFG